MPARPVPTTRAARRATHRRRTSVATRGVVLLALVLLATGAVWGTLATPASAQVEQRLGAPGTYPFAAAQTPHGYPLVRFRGGIARRPQVVQADTDADGRPDRLTYCIEGDVMLLQPDAWPAGARLVPVAPMSHRPQGRARWDTGVAARVAGILDHSSPRVAADAVLRSAGARPGRNTPAEQTQIVQQATQAALWHRTNGWTLEPSYDYAAAAGGAYTDDAAARQGFTAVYRYLVEKAGPAPVATLGTVLHTLRAEGTRMINQTQLTVVPVTAVPTGGRPKPTGPMTPPPARDTDDLPGPATTAPTATPTTASTHTTPTTHASTSTHTAPTTHTSTVPGTSTPTSPTTTSTSPSTTTSDSPEPSSSASTAPVTPPSSRTTAPETSTAPVTPTSSASTPSTPSRTSVTAPTVPTTAEVTVVAAPPSPGVVEVGVVAPQGDVAHEVVPAVVREPVLPSATGPAVPLAETGLPAGPIVCTAIGLLLLGAGLFLGARQARTA